MAAFGIHENGGARIPLSIHLIPLTVGALGILLLATYCPLCNSGVVFDRVVNGIATEFGTTGKLRNPTW